jgi:hypothetical protein
MAERQSRRHFCGGPRASLFSSGWQAWEHLWRPGPSRDTPLSVRCLQFRLLGRLLEEGGRQPGRWLSGRCGASSSGCW